MKRKKYILDIQGKRSRILNAFYRFHKKSGINNKQLTEFECSLRDTPSSKRKKEDKFINIISPIRYQDTEAKVYT